MISYVFVACLSFAIFFTIPVEQVEEIPVEFTEYYTCYGPECVDPEPLERDYHSGWYINI